MRLVCIKIPWDAANWRGNAQIVAQGRNCGDALHSRTNVKHRTLLVLFSWKRVGKLTYYIHFLKLDVRKNRSSCQNCTRMLFMSTHNDIGLVVKNVLCHYQKS